MFDTRIFLFFQETPLVQQWQAWAIGWILIVFLGVLAGIVLWRVWTGQIDLNRLISESTEGPAVASLARFQLLVFTFMITLTIFYIIVNQTPPLKYPDIPAEILGLLGISGGTYAIGKSITNTAAKPTDGVGGTPDNAEGVKPGENVEIETTNKKTLKRTKIDPNDIV